MIDENEQIYRKLLLGEESDQLKQKKIDPTKDPRWNRVKGLQKSLNITIGACRKGKECGLAKFYGTEIKNLLEKINYDRKLKNDNKT